jgi:hypothetical protein
MNQSTTSTSNKLNNTKMNNVKVNNVKVNNVKVNNVKINNSNVNDSKGINNKIPSTGYSGTNIAGMALLVIVLIIVLGSSYWLYNYYSKKSFITVLDVDAMPDVKTASSSFNIASNLIPNSTYSNEYSISCWVNILDYNYNYGKEKSILRRGDKGSANPEIILAPKTNDLIVRIKLQTPTGTNVSGADTFMDIPIPMNMNMPTENPVTLNLDNYEETESESKRMYNDSQIYSSTSSNSNTNNSNLKEKFNISSYPAPVKFENNSNNNNDSLNISSDLGENKIDYPTIKYISNNNNNFDEQYFSMISGNDVDNSKIVNCNDMSDYTRGGNHSTNESFGDVEDAQKLVGDFLTDITNIMDLLVPNTLPETEQYVLSSSICNMIIEFLNQMNTIVKAGTSNFDTITANFKTTMNKSSLKPELSNYVNKLVTDTTNLVKYDKTTFDYSSLTTTINASPIIKSYSVTPIKNTIFNPTNSLLDNLIVLIKQIQVDALQGSINENIPKGSTPTATAAKCLSEKNESSDPTVGTCSIKMIPLQKWVNVIVSVYNQVVDIYIDGLLTSSCVLKTFPAISTSDVTLTPDGGFSGYISRVKFLNSAMTVQKAKAIYYDGPIYSQTLFSQIPNWAYWTILVIIIAAIGYSFFV